MAQEFTIKSSNIEDKINQLLPSQGGAGAGVDFSASTMVIPIVDLTETAEGSGLRQDIQRSLSFTTANNFEVQNTTQTIINTTGYWQLSGVAATALATGAQKVDIRIYRAPTDKTVWSHSVPASSGSTAISIDGIIIKLEAGDLLRISSTAQAICRGSVRQIADLAENLINP
tara:strand:- start:922 stop:1437 length:516 start_codon:yes stop_codon:yes gene_type:complete